MIETNEKWMSQHPYFEKGADPIERDRWIALFRSVFCTEQGEQVLNLLGQRWHFFGRSTPCEEWSVQRQCFIDLLIYMDCWTQNGDPVVVSSIKPDKERSWRPLDWIKRLTRLKMHAITENDKPKGRTDV